MADPQSTPTTHYGWAKPAVGASQDVWGVDLNGNLDSQDTTLWSIQAAQSNYLPLAGGTLTGGLVAVNVTANGGNVYVRAAGSGSAIFWAQNNAGAQMGNFYWTTANVVGVNHLNSTPPSGFYLDGVGTFWTTGSISVSNLVNALGWTGRRGSGTGALTGQANNFYWNNTTLEYWVGAANAGAITVTSDYRVKKDVAPLGSMWETVRALNPISFTFKDYTPPVELERDADAQPLIVGNDIEQWGFIAHELQDTLIPSAASGVKDQADCIQSPNVWTVIATLTRALQEAMGRIEALEAKR